MFYSKCHNLMPFSHVAKLNFFCIRLLKYEPKTFETVAISEGKTLVTLYVAFVYFRYNDNQRAQDAINLSLFHWGIHGWIVFVIVGMNLGFVAYRWKLPMTIRTCFYPIIGTRDQS